MQHVRHFILIAATALCLAGCFGSKVDVAESVARARAFKEQGNLEKARIELTGAVKRSPTNVEANLELARIEEEQGDLQSAIPHYIVAAQPDARLLEPQLRIIDIMLDSNRLAEASGRLNATLGIFPGSPDVLALRADLEERQGQVAAARADAEAALQKDKTNARALAVEAALALRDKDAAAALSFVDRGLDKHPQDLRLLQVRAAALLTLDRPEQAADALKALIRVAPRNVAVQIALAKVEASNGRVDAAIANLQAAVDADPSNETLQLAFVDFLVTQKRGDVATILRKLIEANPKTNTYDLVLAQYLGNDNRLADAAAVLDGAASRLGEGKAYEAVIVAQAKLDAFRGRVDLAADKVGSVLRTDPDNEDALQFRAAMNMQAGRVQAATADLLKVVRANPVNPNAYQLLSSGYLATGDIKLAVDAMQRAVAVAPGDVGAQLRLAAFLQRAGLDGASQELMARLTLRYPAIPEVWRENGVLAIARKDWAGASRSLSKLKDLPEAGDLALALDAQYKAARGDVAGAAGSFQQAIASDPDVDASAFGSYARASVAVGKAAEAADFLTGRAASFKGRSLEQLWAAVMTLRADAGQFDKSGDAFKQAVQAAPRDPEIYRGYVRILLAQRDYQRARAVADQGMEAGVTPSDMFMLQGQIGERSGDPAAALAAYGDALKADPLSLQAANNYASLLADLRPKDTEALRKARDSLNGIEDNATAAVLDTVAWVDYRLGRLDEAKALLTRAGAASSTDPALRFHLAAVLMALGDRSGGQALLSTTKGLVFPGSDEAKAMSET